MRGTRTYTDLATGQKVSLHWRKFKRLQNRRVREALAASRALFSI
jgi:hypothetical protein